MWSNDTKYKYMFMFTLKNSARKELIMELIVRRHTGAGPCVFAQIYLLQTDLKYNANILSDSGFNGLYGGIVLMKMQFEIYK